MPEAVAQFSEVLADQLYVGAILALDNQRSGLLDLCPLGLVRDPFHRRIVEAVRAAHHNGDRISPVTMRLRLANDPAWASVSYDYFENLALAAASVKDGPALIRQMRQEMHRFPVEGRTAYHLNRAGQDNAAATLDYFIKGIWAPGELSAIYGEPGAGKSFVALFLAHAVASGRPAFGWRVRRAPVLVAALEGQTGYPRRVTALTDAYGRADDLYWTAQPVDLFSVETDIAGLIDAIVSVGARVLLVDTFARATPGGRENESADIGAALASTDMIRRETGSHVCLVHHSGKDSAKGMRGHSSLVAAVDVAIEVKRDGTARGIRLAKVKDGKDGDEHVFDLKVIDLGNDDDGDPVTTCIVHPSDAAPEPRRAKLSGQTKVAFDLLVKAVTDHGQQPPPGPFPRDILVCPVTIWRDHCYRGFGTDRDNAETNRRSFNRALTNLKNLNRINVWDDFVWLI